MHHAGPPLNLATQSSRGLAGKSLLTLVTLSSALCCRSQWWLRGKAASGLTTSGGAPATTAGGMETVTADVTVVATTGEATTEAATGGEADMTVTMTEASAGLTETSGIPATKVPDALVCTRLLLHHAHSEGVAESCEHSFPASIAPGRECREFTLLCQPTQHAWALVRCNGTLHDSRAVLHPGTSAKAASPIVLQVGEAAGGSTAGLLKDGLTRAAPLAALGLPPCGQSAHAACMPSGPDMPGRHVPKGTIDAAVLPLHLQEVPRTAGRSLALALLPRDAVVQLCTVLAPTIPMHLCHCTLAGMAGGSAAGAVTGAMMKPHRKLQPLQALRSLSSEQGRTR